MHTLLLVTTKADNSADFFTGVAEWQCQVMLYGRPLPSDITADVVYFRDPFNELDYDVATIENTLAEVRSNLPGAYYVDDIATVQDLLFEDKWRQYKLMPELFPLTKVLEDIHEITSETLAKKRISCRARDIAFSPEQVTGQLADYILQTRLHIEQELRVYVVGGRVFAQGARKSSKTEGSKAKVQEVCQLPTAVTEFAEQVQALVPKLEFYGLDIAITSNGPVLIEVNRSPQFSRYSELTGINLAAELVKAIDSRLV